MILLVEDWLGHVRLVEMALAEAGIRLPLRHAASGKEAAGLLFANGSGVRPERLPSVILLDLSLPDMPGGELLSRIRQDPETRSLPVVALSAADNPDDRQCCDRFGCEGFLVKPPGASEIAEIFTRLGLWSRAAAE